jgi:hypothetical protein
MEIRHLIDTKNLKVKKSSKDKSKWV